MFTLHTKYLPAGDQANSIKELVEGIKRNINYQVLLGITGSGKTFVMANVIQQLGRPVLILSHNKTLASQLFSEMKGFFPQNRVEYFISSFDYYRPESYKRTTDVYVEKVSQTNKKIEAMIMSAYNAISLHRDTIIVASVAAIYGALNPREYYATFFDIEKGMKIKMSQFHRELAKRRYNRTISLNEMGDFVVKGDVVEICPTGTDEYNIRVEFFGDEIDSIAKVDKETKQVIERVDSLTFSPASTYTTTSDSNDKAIETIKQELAERIAFYEKENRPIEKQRIEERVNSDIDALKEFGFCKGIENYARHFDGRSEGETPYTLLDYLPSDTLVIIDESHMTLPQLEAMYKGDRSRKQELVEYGWRLPSALDNRPLMIEEFLAKKFQTIFVSATPAAKEINMANGVVVRQIIRPTGLIDPVIEVHPSENQGEKIAKMILEQRKRNERSLIITITKKDAESIAWNLSKKNIKANYIHSELNHFERTEVLTKLRKGIFEVVIGVGLLKEGIDLPEVSLIMVLDADAGGLYRSTSSLIQIAGRAARNDHGKVILFADNISKQMQELIDDNAKKRKLQIEYNKKHNIVPKTIIKPIVETFQTKNVNSTIVELTKKKKIKAHEIEQLKIIIEDLKKQMKDAANKRKWDLASELRDLIIFTENQIEQKK